MASLHRNLYSLFTYTHAEIREKIAVSGVSTRRKVGQLTLDEICALADAFEVTPGEMIEILLEGGSDE